MSRDATLFPDDENGDALWNMHCKGEDLSKPREFEFSVIFPTKETAFQFGMRLFQHQQKVQLLQTAPGTEMPWQVMVGVVMSPTHERITRCEEVLEKDAVQFGGRNNGWGCWGG